MLAQSNSTPAAPAALSFRAKRDEEMWEKIETILVTKQFATTREISEAIGLSNGSTHKRLVALAALGDVRKGPKQSGSASQAWVLCSDEDAARAGRMQPLLTKAVQIGSFRRDPLVAALFGEPRCVSCLQPQGMPHRRECAFSRLAASRDTGAFNGVDIDAVHQLNVGR